MKNCPQCESELEGVVCLECGWQDLSAIEDRMVAAASVRSLADLYKAGKKRGLIKPTQEYGNTA